MELLRLGASHEVKNCGSVCLTETWLYSDMPGSAFQLYEKIVNIQLQSFQKQNYITEKFQSGFKCCHSTETALLGVFKDLLLTVDSRDVAALLLLDVSAAFYILDHGILLPRLEHYVGLWGTVLAWFKFYLKDRSYSVHLDHCSSAAAPFNVWSPSGFSSGPCFVVIVYVVYIL